MSYRGGNYNDRGNYNNDRGNYNNDRGNYNERPRSNYSDRDTYSDRNSRARDTHNSRENHSRDRHYNDTRNRTDRPDRYSDNRNRTDRPDRRDDRNYNNFDRNNRRDDRRDNRREDRRERFGGRGRDRDDHRGRRGFGGYDEQRGRTVQRVVVSRTPSRTPSYSPVFKERPSQWDQTIANKGKGNSGDKKDNQHLSQRRLYVGNVPDSVDEEELVNFFNNAMIKANIVIKVGEPVIAASIYRDKGYAFIELRSAEEATAGLEFNGINIHGYPLKVNRPNDYKEPYKSGYVSAASQASFNLVSSNVLESDHKIFVGGLPLNISEDKIKKLLSYFGDLQSFNLVREAGGTLSKGFAFCEFANHDVTDYACAELNGMAIGDKTLQVHRASANPHLVQQQQKHQERAGTQSHIQPAVPSAALMLNLSRPGATLLSQAVKNPSEGISKVLVVLNIVNMIDFPGDEYEEDYDHFVDDVLQEAMKYGNVKTILVPRNPFKRKALNPLKVRQSDHTIEKFPFDIDSSSEDDIDDNDMAFRKEIEEALNEEGEIDHRPNVDGFGKVYIEYATIEESKYAMRALSGRRYDGRMVMTMYLDEEKWKDRILEPPLKHEILSMVADLDKDDE